MEMTMSELIDALCICNNKLYAVCNKKHDMSKCPENYSKMDLIENMKNDINLCERRAKLKTAIDSKFACTIMLDGPSVKGEVKSYGN